MQLAFLLAVFVSTFAVADDQPPQATDADEKPVAGSDLEVGKPISLFDGKALDGWTTQDGKPVTSGWKVADGAIYRESRGGNIFYKNLVGDFEFTFEWKIVERGNNGLKYRVRKYGGKVLGCEYQLLGETKPSFSRGSCGSLYELYEPNADKQLNPVGEWNTAKIVAHGPKIEHWMNGKRIVEADLTTDEWRQRLAKSKFAPHQDFARNNVGQIMLTDHGSEVWYRNLILTPLPTKEIPPLANEPAAEEAKPANREHDEERAQAVAQPAAFSFWTLWCVGHDGQTPRLLSGALARAACQNGANRGQPAWRRIGDRLGVVTDFFGATATFYTPTILSRTESQFVHDLSLTWRRLSRDSLRFSTPCGRASAGPSS